MTTNVAYAEAVTFETAMAVVVDALTRALRRQDDANDNADRPDLDVEQIIEDHLSADHEARNGRRQAGTYSYRLNRHTRAFYDAVWDLASRGILRPIAAPIGNRETSRLVGHLYALTGLGREWLANAPEDIALPSEYGRFAQLLASFRSSFGDAYYLRSQEALRCYRAQCYLACCAMSGAAAEAIFLALVSEKVGDSRLVLTEYQRAKGQAWLLSKLMATQNAEVRRQLSLSADLLKYWRDSASHGAPTAIHEPEGFTALLILLRLAQFAADRRAELVSS
jgi:hypothetical protein